MELIFIPPHFEQIKKFSDNYNKKEVYHYALQIEQYKYNYAQKSHENEIYIKKRLRTGLVR